MIKKELTPIEWLKSQCNHYVNGHCTNVSCLKRAGWKPGMHYSQQVNATCIVKELIEELGDGPSQKERATTALFPVEGAIIITAYEFCKVTDTARLHEYLQQESRLVKAKLSRPYFGTHGKVYIQNIYGVPTLSISVYQNCITFWDATGCCTIASYEGTPPEKEVNEILERVTNGERKCNTCGKWFPHAKMVSYSFAGIVCKRCYNPKIHLPPDTRGD